jgi:Zn-dependent M28 family amino/carboxypeptidase
LVRSEAYLRQRWEAQGYAVERLPFTVDGHEVANLQVVIPGTSLADEVVVVGAHYDTCELNPGANDNASGVAAMLELSAHFAKSPPPARTLRFVAFVNEEPPHFQRESMGSLVYAKAAKAADVDVVGMLSLETMGYYTDAPKSQRYPAIVRPLFSDVGNFIGLVSDGTSRAFVKQVRLAFEESVDFPVESLAAPDAIQGIGWSDHWSFYRQGYPSVMVTDTAPNRYAHYHSEEDTPDKLNYPAMSRVVGGLVGVVDRLVRPQ